MATRPYVLAGHRRPWPWWPWVNSSPGIIHVEAVEKVQRRAARFVMDDFSRESSVSQMLHRLDWERLDIRRLRARLTTIYKEVNLLASSNVEHLKLTPRENFSQVTRSDHPLNLKRIMCTTKTVINIRCTPTLIRSGISYQLTSKSLTT